MVIMLLVFLVCDLLAARLGWGWLGGAGYVLGCLLAVRYARREALLLVVTTPPVLYLVALVTAQLATAKGSALLATAEGTLLALATGAPWLLAGTAACLVAALARGLPQSVRDFKAQLSGIQARPGNEARGDPADPAEAAAEQRGRGGAGSRPSA